MDDDTWLEDEEYYRPLSPSMTRTRTAGRSRYGHTAKEAKTMARGVQKFIYEEESSENAQKPQTAPRHSAMQKSAGRMDPVEAHEDARHTPASPAHYFGDWGSGLSDYEPTAREYDEIYVQGELIDAEAATPPAHEYAGAYVSGESDMLSEGEVADSDDAEVLVEGQHSQPGKDQQDRQNRPVSKAAHTRDALHAAVRHLSKSSTEDPGKPDRTLPFRELLDFSGQHREGSVKLFEPFLRIFADSMRNPEYYAKSAAMNVLTDVQDAASWGLEQIPDMNPEIASMFLPADMAHHPPLRCPDKTWRAVDDGVKAAYRIHATTARILNAHTYLAYSMRTHVNELQKKGVEIPAEMLSCALALTGSCGFLASTMGREAHRLVMTRRRIWLAQAKLPENLQKTLFTLPVRLRNDTLFGPDAERALGRIQAGIEAQRTRRQLGMLPATTTRGSYRMRPYHTPDRRGVGTNNYYQTMRGGATLLSTGM